MKRAVRYFFKALGYIFLAFFSYALAFSAIDIYNDFAYDKAILKHTPYGYVPVLHNPNDYGSWNTKVKSGDFVYVEDWTSAINGRIVFAKVKSKTYTGYINQEMLVETNINVYPIISVLLLCLILVLLMRKFYKLLIHRQIVLGKN